MQFEDYVFECKNIFELIKDKIHLVIIANKSTDINNQFEINETMDFLLKMCNTHNIELDYYTSEKKFISILQSGRLQKTHKKVFVFNRMSDGEWGTRRVLVPALCKHYQIPFFGHNSYTMGILCNKMHYSSILNDYNISIPKSWSYDSKYGWLKGKPKNGQKIIIKPIYENNSAGITQKESIKFFDVNTVKDIHNLSLKHNQPIIIQKFIDGYELSVPIFTFKEEIIVPTVIGSIINGEKKYGKNIISDTIDTNNRNNYINERYYNFAEINEQLSLSIKRDCKKIAQVLSVESISRFDLRVDDSFEYYFNDLGSIPGFLPYGNFGFIFKQYGYEYDDFLICAIVSDYIKYYSI